MGVLKISSQDGRDEHIKECNGVGACDYNTGMCKCSLGYEMDELIGPCGKISTQTSDWPGLGRCPGTVSKDAARTDLSGVSNYQRMYISSNALYNSANMATIEVVNLYSDGLGSPLLKPEQDQIGKEKFVLIYINHLNLF